MPGDDGEGRSWQQIGKALVLAGEPRLAFQPIIDLADGQLLGFEALLRWHHPTEGIILPPLLIPWAEANGDIVALGAWVIAESCREASRWPPSLQIAVNCSIVQLRREVAYRAVRDALEETGLDPDRLTVEVTEPSISEPTAAIQLKSIVGLGVQLAVDDVGTSWSSFDLLKRMEVNTVKIDESFVSGLEPREGINRMVVETVIHLAHSAGMSTVAEGVETALHAAIVSEFESDAAQGYFFAPPMDGASAARLASSPDLRFALDGAGWQDDDGWPFADVQAERLLRGDDHRVRGERRGAPHAAGPPEELDAIDFIDLALGYPEEHGGGPDAIGGPLPDATGAQQPADLPAPRTDAGAHYATMVEEGNVEALGDPQPGQSSAGAASAGGKPAGASHKRAAAAKPAAKSTPRGQGTKPRRRPPGKQR
ncbi:MAG: EAL domain-containing protein [Actinomycetota bacterium]|nr:EAL domain-containing protein [Actinomycetota bacterium]